MIFASKEFFIFLPVVLLGYHLLRGRGTKYNFLLLASWLFYGWCSPGYLWVLLALTLIDYTAALRIEAATDPHARRRWLFLSIASNLGLLFAFKYAEFAFDNGVSLARGFGLPAADRHWSILLPLGISFHTFQGISYTVDVSRRQIAAVRSFRDYALFVAFFPQLAAGPIVRAVEFLPQMIQPPVPTREQVEDGLRLFVLGLFKKLFIADQLHHLFVDPVFANPMAYDAATLRWAAIAWAVQIYCDFSGYTDMALGTAKWFGFNLPANFHLPYLATSITDFWRRWHLSLSTWLRDYLYFPLGGSRGSAARTYFNLLTIFVLCGLWHGAAWHWLVYGLYNGILMSLHRALDRATPNARWRKNPLWTGIAWVATFYQLLLGLVLIRMTNWESGWQIARALVGCGADPVSTKPIPPLAAGVLGVPYSVLLLLSFGLIGHALAFLSGSRWERWFDRVRPISRGFGYAAAVVLVVAFSPGVGKSFIYIAF
jgi:alginate O-acetyltransferase complex protein AlgI